MKITVFLEENICCGHWRNKFHDHNSYLILNNAEKKNCIIVRFGHLEISASTSRHLQHQHRYSNLKIVFRTI